MKHSSHTAEATISRILNGCAGETILPLTESEKSRLMVIRREAGRGYALTITDIRWLMELTERAGL